MIFDPIFPRNEGSGGSNEILVGFGWKVWECSFKVALHGSILFHELQISYKLLTLFCWPILILGEEEWDCKVGGLLNIGWHLAVIEFCQIVCGWNEPKVHGKWQKGYKIHEGTLCPRGKGGESIHGFRMCHGTQAYKLIVNVIGRHRRNGW